MGWKRRDFGFQFCGIKVIKFFGIDFRMLYVHWYIKPNRALSSGFCDMDGFIKIVFNFARIFYENRKFSDWTDNINDVGFLKSQLTYFFITLSFPQINLAGDHKGGD